MSELKPCPFCGEQPEVGHYETFDNDEWYIGCDCECGPCTKSHLTYEQAIAAWNTRADYHGYEQAAIEAWESIKAWNARAEHGTLTAGQVREAIACNSWQETSMLFEFNASSWQAIADDLNARAERTCRNDKDKWSGLAKYLFVCSECGWNLADVGNDAIDISARLMKRCPMCGAKVIV